MNIFELLKHKNHDLELVKVDKDTIAFGCCTCGVEILNSSCLDGTYDKILNMKSSLVDSEAEEIIIGIEAFEKEIFKLYHAKIIDFLDIIGDIVYDELTYDREVCLSFSLEDILFDKEYFRNEVVPSGHNPYWIEKIVTDNFGDISKELTELAYKILTEKYKYKVLKYGESITVSNNIIENDDSDSLIVLHEERINRMEEENPTVTDIKTFANEEEFVEYILRSNKDEFIYRTKNDLLDTSNLNMDKCIEDYDAYCGETKLNSLFKYLNK